MVSFLTRLFLLHPIFNPFTDHTCCVFQVGCDEASIEHVCVRGDAGLGIKLSSSRVPPLLSSPRASGCRTLVVCVEADPRARRVRRERLGSDRGRLSVPGKKTWSSAHALLRCLYLEARQGRTVRVVTLKQERRQ